MRTASTRSTATIQTLTSLVTCSVRIDDCASNPCENYGQCVDSINAYFCMCLPGFTGENCELNIDDCKPNPCHHGGGCVDAVNGFMCECAGTGFEGRVGATETSTNDCADVIRALGDEAEEEDDLEMGEGDDDADVATDAAAPTVDPLQAQKDRNSHQKLRLKTEQENEAAADEPVRVNEFDVYVHMHAVHVHSLFTECVSSSHSLQLRRKTEKAEEAQSPR